MSVIHSCSSSGQYARNSGLALFLLVLFWIGCQPSADERRQAHDPELLHASVKKLTDVMVRDVLSPAHASRVYAYASIAGYEALVPGHPEQQSLAGQLNELQPPPAPEPGVEYEPSLAALHALLTVGKEMVYTDGPVADFQSMIHAQFEEMEVSQRVRQRSITYGEQVAQHILAWARTDNYRHARSGPKFTVTDEPGRWKPTPPAYMEAVEPNWGKLRPFVMDSAAQFKPPRPHPYSMKKGSAFYQQVEEVYTVGKNLNKEQREIAAFWNCNPYVMHTRGHAMFVTKQLSPGGHWMGIAAIAARQSGADFMRTAETYAQVAVALADGFISAWNEKYRSSLVRPETIINEHVDPSWRPALQTPPFPEYTSAHSVISASAAITLTDLYGDGFAFRDTTETEYGLPVRSFGSFAEAAQEAAISRLYGGIHYRMAIERGTEQGREVGRYVVRKVDTRRPTSPVAESFSGQ